jgi:hypothetical protein
MFDPAEHKALVEMARDLDMGSLAEVTRYVLGLGVVVQMGEDAVTICHGIGWRNGIARAMRAVERAFGSSPKTDEVFPPTEGDHVLTRTRIDDQLHEHIRRYCTVGGWRSMRDAVRRLVLAGMATQRVGCAVAKRYEDLHREGMRRAGGAALMRLRGGKR